MTMRQRCRDALVLAYGIHWQHCLTPDSISKENTHSHGMTSRVIYVVLHGTPGVSRCALGAVGCTPLFGWW